MRRCPACGFNNVDTRDRCLKCSAALVSQPLHLSTRRSALSTLLAPWYALRAGWYHAAGRLVGPLPSGLSHRYPWTAAYLSLLAAGGQWYNHQPRKAIAFGLIQAGFVAWVLATWFQPINDLVLALAVAWCLMMMADGFITAARINGDPWRFRHLLAMWSALFFFLGVFLAAGQLLGWGFFLLPTVLSREYGPQLERGDKLFVLQRPFCGRPRPGSVIFYNPKRLVYERGADIFSLNEQSGFGVVTAVEGQVVDWDHGGPVRVDGVEVPPRLWPINPAGTPGRMEFRVRPGHYGVLYTHGATDMLSGAVSDPRTMTLNGAIMKGYDEVVQVPDKDIFGIVLFCYYPPERRRWFGWSGGLWSEPAAGAESRRPATVP
jgi:hypothetical protein